MRSMEVQAYALHATTCFQDSGFGVLPHHSMFPITPSNISYHTIQRVLSHHPMFPVTPFNLLYRTIVISNMQANV